MRSAIPLFALAAALGLICAAGDCNRAARQFTSLSPKETPVMAAGKEANATSVMSAEESPFACNMLALAPEGRARHLDVIKELLASRHEIKEIPDGYAFRFDSGEKSIMLASEFIARERLCCPFFTFELKAEREGGPVWLRLRGREGVKPFIREEFKLDG